MGTIRTAAPAAIGSPSEPAPQPLRQGSMAATSRLAGERMFLTHLKTIERLAAIISARRGLSADEVEEFTAVVYLQLIKDDYHILRQFVGRSTLKTFLTVVIRRLLIDFQNSRWGRWRPSTASRQCGPLAVILERLTVRDGLTFDEAWALLAASHDLTTERRSLEQLHARFRGRLRPRLVADINADEWPTASGAPDDAVQRSEEAAAIVTAVRYLGAALARVPQQDQLILKLRFVDRLPLNAIARQLNLNQRGLYRRVERLMGRLRRRLECHGVRRDAVLSAIGKHDIDGGVFSAVETTNGWLAHVS